MGKKLFSFTILIAILVISGCDGPGEFIRSNTNDPFSDDFDFSVYTFSTLEAKTVDFKTVELRWGNLSGIDKYRVLRRSQFEDEYSQIEELKDTTYTDGALGYGKYYYQIEAVTTSNRTAVIGSTDLFTNYINFSNIDNLFPDDVANVMKPAIAGSFIMPISENKIFAKIGFEYAMNYFLLYDLNNHSWEQIHFSGFPTTDLTYRTQHFIPLSNEKFLFINKSGTRIGSVCDINSRSCTNAGEISRSVTDIRGISSAHIDENRVLITGVLFQSSHINRRIAYIFDSRDESFTEVSEPKLRKIPTSIVYMGDGKALVSGRTPYSNFDGGFKFSEIYDIQNDRWLRTSEKPIVRDVLFSKNIRDGKVFLYGDFDGSLHGRSGLMYDLSEDSWKLVPQPRHSPELVFSKSSQSVRYLTKFRQLINTTSDHNILLYTNRSVTGERRWVTSYYHFIEKLDVSSNEWTQLYELPSHIDRVLAMEEIDTDIYLIIYSNYEDNGLGMGLFVYDPN